MGADFLKEKTRREKKAWKAGSDKLKQRRIDDRRPAVPRRIIKFEGRPQPNLKVGENVNLLSRDQKLVAYSGIAEVGRAPSDNDDVRELISRCYGLVTATVSHLDRSTGALEVVLDCSVDTLKKALPQGDKN